MKTKLAKISASSEADQALDRMVVTVNEGFTGGRVTKHDLISWAVLYFEKHCLADCMEAVRRDHFDEVAYLENVLHQAKAAKKSGGAELDIGSLLSPLLRTGRPERTKTRAPRPAQDEQAG